MTAATERLLQLLRLLHDIERLQQHVLQRTATPSAAAPGSRI